MATKTELIIGAFSRAFPSETGVYDSSAIDYRKIYENLVIAPRFTLENNPAVRHLISYYTVSRVYSNQERQYLVYQRPDVGNGESRLAGNHSIGFGGHTEALEIADLMTFSHAKETDTPVQILETVQISSTARELDEELKLTSGDKFSSMIVHVSQPHSMIIDNSNNVGLHHVGIVGDFLITSDEINFVGGEDQINVVGWFTLEEIKKQFGETLENWSSMLVENFSNL